MAKKYPLTDPTGEKAKARQDKKTDARIREKIKERFKDVGETAQKVGESVKTAVNGTANAIGTAQNVAHSVSNSAKSIRQAVTGGSQLVTHNSDQAFEEASKLAQQFGIADIKPNDLLGSDPYKADANIPEMSAKDANREKLTIQRQNNALEVRLEKIKQGRKGLQVATEQRKLIGDVVGFHTAGIEVGSKMIENQIADTTFRTKQSKLEETEELLIHQQIQTQGTINLTPGIRQEWEIKVEAQQTRIDTLKLTLEGARRDNLLKAEELEAKILGGY